MKGRIALPTITGAGRLEHALGELKSAERANIPKDFHRIADQALILNDKEPLRIAS